jgi:hypothetical protein
LSQNPLSLASSRLNHRHCCRGRANGRRPYKKKLILQPEKYL